MHAPLIESRRASVLLLALALLLAQWVGMAHRIAHASLPLQDRIAAPAHEEKDSAGFHSCAAFDAATVGDAVHFATFDAGLVASARMLALWVAFLCWDAPPVNYFSSRAPPLT